MVFVLIAVATRASVAALTKPELKCADGIALTARNYFKDRYKTITKCENKKADGSFASSVVCRPNVCSGGANDGLACVTAGDCPDGICVANSMLDSKTATKLQKAAEKVTKKIDKKCGDPIPAAVVLGLPCGTASTVAEVSSCIVDQAHGLNADRLIETVYDDTGDLSANQALLDCQTFLAKESLKYAKARMTARRVCAKKLEGGKIEGPCPDEKTLKKLDKALVKLRDKVLAVCTDAQVLDAAKDFGFPCESFSQITFQRDGMTNNNAMPPSERLIRCIAASAAGDADLGADTAYPLPDAAPFSFGVAAGDPTNTSFIAWTRTDGAGTVGLEVATDEAFSNIVFSNASLTPDPAADNTVKAEVTGLPAGTASAQYFYRFTQGGDTSATGSVRTAPAPGSTAPVRFVWTGDANAYFKPYTVLDGILRDDPEVWLFIGDTIYGDDPRSGSGVAMTRSDYHAKYRENRSDRSTRNIMAKFGTIAMWDDHEVTNDFWGTDPSIQTQMADGNQAFRDYMPIRENGGDPMQLYRSIRWGKAAEFFLIDDRQYRSAQAYVTEPACLSGGEPATIPPAGACTTEINNPSRTYLGTVQKQWLKDGLLNSTATFKFVMNGPLLSSLLFVPYDRWEGYAAERTEMIDFIKNNNIKNVIFLSTDIHGLIVNDAVGGTSTPVIRELVAGAIGMDPIFRELPASVAGLVPTLPALFPTISYFDIDRFNYGLIEVTPTEATVTYRDNTGAALTTFTIPAVP